MSYSMKRQDKKSLLEHEFGRIAVTKGSIFGPPVDFKPSPSRDPVNEITSLASRTTGFIAGFSRENIKVSMLGSEMVPTGMGKSQEAAITNLFNLLKGSDVKVYRSASPNSDLVKTVRWNDRVKDFKLVKG